MPTELTVNGMTCQGCEQVVEKALQMVDGVESADADRYEDVAVIESESELDTDALVERVEMAGYEGSD